MHAREQDHLLTVEFRGSSQQGKGQSEHRMVLGTHTSESEQNYLMIAKVCPWLNPPYAACVLTFWHTISDHCR